MEFIILAGISLEKKVYMEDLDRDGRAMLRRILWRLALEWEVDRTDSRLRQLEGISVLTTLSLFCSATGIFY
jgi:hypothetical protein